VKVYLVGFMGSGKTTVGRLTAGRLGVPFFDRDELVETSEGVSIREVFATFGEPHFRKREREILRSTQHVEAGVFATGGGTFTFEDNIQFILAHGVSVHLSVPLQTLLHRIGDKAAERPMFRDEESLRELYQYRLRYYKMSDVTLEIRDDESVPEVVERLLIQLPKEALGHVSRRHVPS